MSTLTVGTGQEYSTIAAAVQASSADDTIAVQAGTYKNDFVTITHDLTLQAVGGTVNLVETEQPPNGKAYIDEGGSGASVTIEGFNISGVSVPDGNGAAVRYEGGNLTLVDDNFHNNQNGILGAADPNGNITINYSIFSNNGAGDGYTHNIYIGAIAGLTVENSTIASANVGHDIKSRAETTTIINNVISDGSTGTASYEIDLPNGGNATIEGNIIEKGAHAQNPIAISYGEEGSVYASSSLTVLGNTVLNDDTVTTTTAVKNATSVTATIEDNRFYGWTNTSAGGATLTDNTALSTEPSLSSLTPGSPAIQIITGNVDGGVTLTGLSNASANVAIVDIVNGRTTVIGSAIASGGGKWSVTTHTKIDSSMVNTFLAVPQDATGKAAATSGGLVLASTGTDTLTATPNVSDVFAVMSFRGSDMINSFEPASAGGQTHDYIDFSGRGITSFSQVQSMMSGTGSTIINIGSGKMITLSDIAPTALTASDFRFS